MTFTLVPALQGATRQRWVGIGTAAWAAVLLVGLSASSAFGATTTIGQLAPNNSPAVPCAADPGMPFETLEPTVSSGNSYAVPAGGAAITSWSTNAANASVGQAQQLKLKVWRKVADPALYQVVGHDGFRPLTAGTLNTFPVNLAAQPGDVIGLTISPDSDDTGCVFDSPGNTSMTAGPGDFLDGASASFSPVLPNLGLNVSAVVAGKASNEFDLVKVKKNKNNGTATLTVDVPGPGELSLRGTGVKAQRAGGATISKEVTQAGKVKLKVKAKGAKKNKLLDRGKVKVKVKVTFKPSASGGDVAGDPNTEPKKIKLIDNG